MSENIFQGMDFGGKWSGDKWIGYEFEFYNPIWVWTDPAQLNIALLNKGPLESIDGSIKNIS
jgi:hypothetical protein